MRALVTGGAGFLGAQLVAALVADGNDVAVLDDLSTGHADEVDHAARLVVGDVTDPGDVDALARGCDVVFHLAASRSVPRSLTAPLATDRANTAGTLTVLDAARLAGVRRVVLASSSSVYGQATQLPTPESAPLLPCSPYAVSKLAGEHYARVYNDVFGVETVALRYFNLYGPGQRLDMASPPMVAQLLASLLAGRPPELHDGGTRQRDLVFVTDAVAATLAAGNAPAERVAGCAYNVGTGRSHSVIQVLDILQRLLGTAVDGRVTPPRAGDVLATQAGTEQAAAELGWRATVDLEEGLTRAVAALAPSCMELAVGPPDVITKGVQSLAS